MPKPIKIERAIGERLDITLSFDNQTTKGLAHGQVEVLVSNSGLDRHGEQIMVDGIDLSQIKRNPVVLWAHDYMGLPIGKITKLWKSAGNLMARIQLDTDVYEFANTVYQLIMKGTINAVSIGGIVKEWNDTFDVVKSLEMIELSVVPVGAHPDALVTAKSLGMKAEDIREQYESFVHKSLLNKLEGQSQDEIQLQIKALKTLVSALESTYKGDPKDTEDGNKKKTIRRLVISKGMAKQADKQSELLIAAINKSMSNLF